MEKSFPVVAGAVSIEEVSKLFGKETQAVIVAYGDEEHHIITRQDVISAIG